MKYKSTYLLDNRSGKKKFRCPACGHTKTFTLYIHAQTMGYLSEVVGICDRINNCGHHLTPKQYLIGKPESLVLKNANSFANTQFIEKPISYIDNVNLTLSQKKDRNQNHLFQYLVKRFGNVYADILFRRYLIGSSDKWPGATVFWQVDIEQKIRAGKIMLFDQDSGRRVKEPFSHISWVHKNLKFDKEFNLKQCFFGEHILKQEPGVPVALVESERTALICYTYFPEYIWLAAGSLHGLCIEKCKVLKGREVVLFPDLGIGYEIWEKKAVEIRQALGLNLKVNYFLAQKAFTDNGEGMDLADFIYG
jgi:hypothetical protein